MLKIIPILLFCNSCMNPMRDLPADEKIAYKMMGRFSTHSKAHGLYGIGAGLMGDKSNDKIAAFDLIFTTEQTLTISLARELIIKEVNQFVNFINTQNELQPYVSVYPVTPKQVILTISGLDRTTQDSNYVSSVVASQGSVIYFNGIMEAPNYGCIYEETYEEAVAKLKITHP